MPIYSIKETNETSARTLLLLKIMEMTNHSRNISKIEQGIYVVAHQMYNFSKNYSYTSLFWENYYGSFLLYLSGSDTALHTKELIGIHKFFINLQPNLEYLTVDYSEQVKTAVNRMLEQINELTESVKEQRKLMKGCFPLEILRKIEPFIRYCTEIKDIDSFMLYAGIYHLGYVAGKREERKRKQQSRVQVKE